MSTEIRKRLATENAEENIAYLATMSDSELVEKLDIIHMQSVIAEKEKNTSSLKLLEVWRSQVIAARIYKIENNISDVPKAIDLALAEMEAQEEKAEQRQEILKEETAPVPQPKARVEQKDDDSQLTLF